jgi:predicted PurR-regulated permease PerM
VRSLLPRERRAAWDGIATDVRDVLAAFIRGTSLVALGDAIGIAIGLLLLGVPLVVPLAVLTFVGGFVPIVGAAVAGFVAIMVALVSNGFVTALAVLGVVIAVQQFEGNVMQPFVVGRSVNLHPVVVLLAVSMGAVLWGVAGALLAVPVAAAVSTVLAGLRDEAAG